ncbi:hypothetical protein CDAR_256771 [Caerostris darwini]|uniref:Uncharacterized protein n=1 Tax=Caerostris darwini TaxID=1538125 RepID=A0AAV4Q0P3_9ARAC|nr:hypothetical protein CDAR_256771 [Caerostris darwini]
MPVCDLTLLQMKTFLNYERYIMLNSLLEGQKGAPWAVVVARVRAPLSQGSRTASDLGVSYEGRGENPGVIGRERESIYIGVAVTPAIATPRKQP